MNHAEARDVIAAVLHRIAPEIDLATSDPHEPLTRELDLDSMDVLSLLVGIGDRTGIEIPEADVQPDWSLEDLAGYLMSH